MTEAETGYGSTQQHFHVVDDENAPQLPELTLPETITDSQIALEMADAVIEGGINSDDDELDAKNALEQLSTTKKAIEMEFKQHAELANKAWKSITEYRKSFLEPMAEKDREIRRAVEVWMLAERRRKETERKEAERAEEKRILDEAAELEAENKPAAAEHVMETAPERIAQVTAPVKTERPKTSSSGMQGKAKWTAKLVDPDAFFKALAEQPALRDLVKVNEGELNRRAQNIKGESPIPGVEFTEGIGVSL